MSINIQQAEDYLCAIVPGTIPLYGEVNEEGIYRLFNMITVNNGATEDVSYHFHCYVAAPDSQSGKTPFYNCLNNTLNQLLKAGQTEQKIDIKEMQSYSRNQLMICQFDIAVTLHPHTEIEA